MTSVDHKSATKPAFGCAPDFLPVYSPDISVDIHDIRKNPYTPKCACGHHHYSKHLIDPVEISILSKYINCFISREERHFSRRNTKELLPMRLRDMDIKIREILTHLSSGADESHSKLFNEISSLLEDYSPEDSDKKTRLTICFDLIFAHIKEADSLNNICGYRTLLDSIKNEIFVLTGMR